MIDDVDRIMAVMAVAFDPEYREAWNRGQIESALIFSNCHVILISPQGLLPIDDEVAAGFILSRSALDEEELLLFAVAPEFRGCGLGGKMLEQLFENCRGRGVISIHLEMRRGNPAENLYRAHGFEPVGQRPKYYRTSSGLNIDAITFRLSL
ncbi:MAG: family N-acetyltransferase [Novosphingobium sp.]|nr:family N-acetyltransferase [Novosphingobium sp.]